MPRLLIVDFSPFELLDFEEAPYLKEVFSELHDPILSQRGFQDGVSARIFGVRGELWLLMCEAEGSPDLVPLHNSLFDNAFSFPRSLCWDSSLRSLVCADINDV